METSEKPLLYLIRQGTSVRLISKDDAYSETKGTPMTLLWWLEQESLT